MNTVGYSIFNHAQLGHIDREPIRPQATAQCRTRTRRTQGPARTRVGC